ncbi:HNH endonuclease [Vibrio phage F102]
MKRGTVYPIGTKIGMFTTTGEVVREGGRQYYPVICDCGTSKLVRNDRFNLNVVGCGKCKDFYQDHTGEVYKGTTITGFSHKIGKCVYWKSTCICGQELEPRKLQSIKQHTGKCNCYNKPENLQFGEKSGMFTFLKYSQEVTSGGKNKLVCKCDCGKRLTISPWFFKNNEDGCKLHKNPVVFKEGKTILDVSTVSLQGKYLILDAEDYSKIYKTHWYAVEGRNTIYANGSVDGRTRAIHQIILPVPLGKLVDHQDQDGLNNRKGNLRCTDKQGNARNTVIHRDNTSGAMGVSWKKDKNKWKAYTSVYRKQIHLGYFELYEDAVLARKAAEVKYGFHENHGRVGNS